MELIATGLLAWIVLAIGAGAIARSKGRSFIFYFLIGALLPLIGFLLAIGMSDRRRLQAPETHDRRPRRKCPACAEMVLAEASRCARCGETLTPIKVSRMRSVFWGPLPPKR